MVRPNLGAMMSTFIPLNVLKYGNLAANDMANFSPRDGLICYEGPIGAITLLYKAVRDSELQFIFADSKLHMGHCQDRDFHTFNGSTCFGDTFVNTMSLQPHLVDEEYSRKRYLQEVQIIDKWVSEPGCLENYETLSPLVYENLAAKEMVNFSPRDGAICYQGPKDGQTKLYNNVKTSHLRFIFEESQLHTGSCENRGFRKSIGNTCFGDTFLNTWNMQPHLADENYSRERFKNEFSAEATVEARPACLVNFLHTA